MTCRSTRLQSPILTLIGARFQAGHGALLPCGAAALLIYSNSLRLTWIGRLRQVIQHLVTMIGPHGNRTTRSLHQANNLSHDGGHICISFEVIRLVKVASCIALGASQMQEVNMIS